MDEILKLLKENNEMLKEILVFLDISKSMMI